MRGATVRPRTMWMALAVATPIATVAAGLCLLPLWRSDPALATAVTFLFASLFAIGVAMSGEPGQRGPAYALIASGLLVVLSWAEEWRVGPLPLLSSTFGMLWILLGGWALYRYPAPRLTRWDTAFFRVMLFWFVVPSVAHVLVTPAVDYDYPPGTFWPPTIGGGAWSPAVAAVQDSGLIVLAVVYIVRWLARVRHARPVERRLTTPPAIGAVVAATAAALVPIGDWLDFSELQMSGLYLIEASAAIIVPVSLLVAILRRQLARTRVTALVLGIKGLPSTQAIVAALRSALEDPSLELAYWSSQHVAFVGQDGAPVPAHRLEGRLQATVEATTGEPLALVLADPALVRDPDLLDAAATVAGFSLEIARLVETVKTQLVQARTASARAVHAADAERRRLEQNLHDGAQQHLLALGPMIGAVEASTREPQTAHQLSEIRALLTHALKELRELAHGIHPAALNRGLGAAVQDLAYRLPVDVQVRLPDDDDLPKETAHAVYLVVSEALANAAKHSQASLVEVTGRAEDGVLRLTVHDDGVGGAHRNGGLGIPGMTDRVAALGGRLDLDSPPGAGTTVTLSVPCTHLEEG